MAEAINWVDPPVYQTRGFGLFAAATIIEDPEPILGQFTWEQDACTPADSWAECMPAVPLPSNVGGGTISVAIGAVTSGSAAVTFTLAGFPATTAVQVDPGDGLPLPASVTTNGSGAATVTYTYRNPGTYNASAVGGGDTAWIAVVLAASTMPKLIPGPMYGLGRGFAVTNGIQCLKVGLVDGRTRAAKRLAMSEQQRVEYEVMTGRAGNYPYLAGPQTTIVDGGTSTPDLVTGLGFLEQALGDVLGAQGLIHAPRYMAPVFADHWLTEMSPGGRSRTTTSGTPVVFGAGYPPIGPDGVRPAAGDSWLYASGPVVIRRAPVIVTETFSGTASTAGNVATILAERQYEVLVDCPLLAIKVAVPSPPAP